MEWDIAILIAKPPCACSTKAITPAPPSSSAPGYTAAVCRCAD